VGASVSIQQPLVDVDSAYRHGVRRQVVTSQYVPPIDGDTAWHLDAQRRRFVAWHALNPYYLGGKMDLAIGRPDIRVGHRVVVEGGPVPEWYYVEGIDHSFTAGARPPSLRTSLTVTRGWLGDAESHVQALQQTLDRWRPAVGAVGVDGAVQFTDAPEALAEGVA